MSRDRLENYGNMTISIEIMAIIKNIGLPSITCLLFSAWVGDVSFPSRILEFGDF